MYTTKEGNSRCLNLRFEGLWDTVPHLGYLNGNESKYNFTIPAAVKYAAQAVALNEHRGGLANFNALSILNAPANFSGGNRNEVGFIGSHADIGGGYGTGDLSSAALMWMVAQGTAQGIKFDPDTIAGNGWNVISNPIVHDKSNNKDHPGQVVSDRTFTYGNGQSVAQHDAVIGGYDTASASRMVNYYNDWCGPIGAPAVGLVDAQKYEAWLKSQGVNVTITAPNSTPVCQ